MYRSYNLPWFVRMVAFNPPSPGKWLLALGFTVLFGGLAAFTWTTYQEVTLLLRDGSTVIGSVTGRDVIVREDSEGRESRSYYLNYAYDAGRGDPPDIRYGRQEVSQNFYNAHGMEADLEVYYLPGERGTSGIDMSFRTGNTLLMLIAFAGVAVVAAYVVLMNLIAARY